MRASWRGRKGEASDLALVGYFHGVIIPVRTFSPKGHFRPSRGSKCKVSWKMSSVKVEEVGACRRAPSSQGQYLPPPDCYWVTSQAPIVRACKS